MNSSKDIVSTTSKENNRNQNEDLNKEEIMLSGDIEIILKILEFHNIPTDDRENILSVTFMNRKLEGEGDLKFTECPCHPENIASSIWRLKFSNINETILMDLSSNPLVLSISKLKSPAETLIKFNENQEKGIHCSALALCCIDMGDLISDKIEIIRSEVHLYPSESQSSPFNDLHPYHDLHPDLAQINYILTTSKPIVGKRENENDLEISTVTIKTEFIMHPSSSMFETVKEFDINIELPLKEDESKSIRFKQGFPSTLKKLPLFVTRYGLSNLPGDAKYSNIATRKDTDFADLNCSLNFDLEIHSDSNVICLNEVCCFKLHTPTIQSIMETNAIPVEMICKNESDIHKLAGKIDLKIFNYVGQTRIRQAIPLITVSSVKTSKTNNSKPSRDRKSKIKQTGAKKKSKESLTSASVSESESESKNLYVMSGDGHTTCLILEITLDRPLIKLKTEVMELEEIKMMEKKVFVDSGIPMLDRREIVSIFQAEITKFITKWHELKNGESDLMNDLWTIADENLLGSAAWLIANKFDFSESMDEDMLQALLRKSYVYLINQAYDVINEYSDINKDYLLQKLINFRLQCAEECRELGYSCAKHFHLMNLKDTASSAERLLDYAVFNFRIGDTEKALVCALDAQEKDPDLFDSYFLEAYFYYKRDKKKCELILKKLTKFCPNFLEAWIVLYLLHIDDLHYPDPEQKQIEEWMNKAALFPFIGQLHKMDCIFWVPPGKFENIFAIAISNFIRWGCAEFAELTLANSVRELRCFSDEYIIFKALISYIRGRYNDALEILSRIKPTCACRSKTDQANRLKALCLLNVKSQDVIILLDVLNIDQQQNTCTAQCNLLNLKIGMFLAESGSRKVGRHNLKKTCKNSGTYASLIEFGNFSMKCSAFDDALACFKMAYKMNPYDWYHWAKMAFIYFRSDLVNQYRICAKNARENKITDETVSRELDKIDQIING